MFNKLDARTQYPAVSSKKLRDSVSGDLGAKRAEEGNRAIRRGIKKDGEGNLPAFPMNKVRLANDGGNGAPGGGAWPKGPDTMGGVIGGKADKADYQGRKAGRGR